MREKRWSLSICTGCGGVVGLARGLAAACDCRPSHAKTGETIVVTPAQSNPELGLEGGEAAKKLKTIRSWCDDNPASDEHSGGWLLASMLADFIDAPATPTQQPDEDQVEARCDGSGTIYDPVPGVAAELPSTCPGCSACRALRVAAAMLAPTDGDDGFIPVTPDASQIEAAQRVIDLVERTQPACQSGPEPVGGKKRLSEDDPAVELAAGELWKLRSDLDVIGPAWLDDPQADEWAEWAFAILDAACVAPTQPTTPEPTGEGKGVVYIARCPEHGPYPRGLHGARRECFDCGGPVEQIPMLPVPALDKARGAAAAIVKGPSRPPETAERGEALIDQARELGQEILDALEPAAMSEPTSQDEERRR